VPGTIAANNRDATTYSGLPVGWGIPSVCDTTASSPESIHPGSGCAVYT